MSRSGTILCTPQLKSSLVNLPKSIVATLSQRNILPQSLIVQLTPRGKDREPLFVGWTGLGSTAAFGNVENIEIDSALANDSALGDGEHVTITLHRSIPVAKSVSVDPLSVDDWEILESNAGLLEDTLLSQVRAVKPGSTVGVWAAKNVRCRFRVDSTDPPSTSVTTVSRLGPSTEIHIAPRTRATSSKDEVLDPAKADDTDEDRERHIKEVSRHLLRFVIADSTLECLADSLDSFSLTELKRELDEPEEKDKTVALVDEEFFKIFIKAFPQEEAALVIRPRKALQISNPTIRSAPPSKPVPSVPEEWVPPGLTVRVKAHRDVPRWHVLLKSPKRRGWSMWLGLEGEGSDLELARFVRIPPTSKPNPAWKDKLKQDEHPILKLGGVEKQMKACTTHLVVSVVERRLLLADTATAYGILLTGPPGSGKTSFCSSFATSMAKDLRTLTYKMHVDLSKYTEERMSVVRNRIIELFDEAAWHAPTLLIFDGLDKLCPAELEHADKSRTRTLTQVLLHYIEEYVKNFAIILLATSDSQSSLNKCLASSLIWRTKVNLASLDRNGRREVITSLLEYKAASTSDLEISQLDQSRLVELTEGYLPSDIRDVIDRAVHESAIRSLQDCGSNHLELELRDFEAAQKDFVPVSLKNVKLQKSDVQWGDIGGLRETKQVVRETLEFPTKYARIFAQSPLRLRSGLLLYGYPGCGKTLLASAVAKECGLNFISVKGPELLNKYIGQSEASVRELFDRATAAKPCVLFFDEFDSIAPKRGHDSTGVTDRVVNQMLTQMDGAEGLEGVYVLAATSRPDLIDPALLRPGRLDKSIICDMPNYEDRLDILVACSRKVKLAEDVDLSIYASRTEGYSGADLQAFIYNAHLDTIQSSLAQSDEKGKGKEEEGEDDEVQFEVFGGSPNDSKVLTRQQKSQLAQRVCSLHPSLKDSRANHSLPKDTIRPTHYITTISLERALKTTRPSVPKDEMLRLKRIYDQFISGRSEGGLPSGEASMEIGGRSSLM
ncbi:AAA-domain-containing protein [Atractiella rhizophila]|nr:AAA-domain-containing protein [Atractiella rhizophila]